MDIRKGYYGKRKWKSDNTNNWMVRGKEKNEEQGTASDRTEREQREMTVLVQ